MSVKPLGNTFLFAFFNETSRGRFIERNKGSIIMIDQALDEQGKYARWAKVLAIGPDVKDFGVGDIVLIEAGMWTLGFEYDGVKIWKSDDTKVCAIGADESVTYAY